MNTVTTLPSKGNLIFEIYDSTKKNEEERHTPVSKNRGG